MKSINYNNYKNLLYLIAERDDVGDKDREYILTNINNITNNMIYFSNIINKIIGKLSDNTISNRTKVKAIMKFGFTRKESNELFNTLMINNQTGGALDNLKEQTMSLVKPDDELVKEFEKCTQNLPQLMLYITLNIPKLMLESISLGFQGLANIFNLDWSQFEDYKKPLDLMYIFLFMSAVVPFMGAVADTITIIRALDDQRIFLAAMVTFTRFLSFFTLNILDLGFLIKVLYSLDVYSYTNYSKKVLKNKSDTKSESDKD